jgi:hypothetical protein
VHVCVVTASGVRSLSVEAARRTLGSSSDIVWIDLGHDDREGMCLLTDLVGAQPDDVDDCSNRMPVPKLHAYADHYFSAINGLARGQDGRLYFQPSAIRLQMLRTQQSLVTEAATRAAELEKSVMSIDRVKAETVLNDLFSLRHDLQTIRTNAAQTHELYVHLIATLDSQDGLMRLDVRRLALRLRRRLRAHGGGGIRPRRHVPAPGMAVT